MALDLSKFGGSKFFKPEIGHEYTLWLTNWRQEKKGYGEQQENPRETAIFDVVAIDNVNFAESPKVWEISNWSFLKQINPLLERAEANPINSGRGYKTIICKVLVKKNADKTYAVFTAERFIDGKGYLP